MQIKTNYNTVIDLKSDTVTLPTQGMLQAMLQARVGDDVFEEDPATKELEQKLADLFGKEKGLFCPSGTMSNQIAIKLLTSPGDEVLCDRLSHLYNYEGGGVAFNSGASVRLLHGDRGRFTAEEVKANINPDDVHFPKSKLVVIENTCNKGGGSCWNLEEIIKIHSVCKQHGISMHLDGARIFNALIKKAEQPEEHARFFDTVSVCLSKGLGAPVGSVLLGPELLIKQARRIRKVLGGGMRQSGYLAAAGIYALDHHVERLAEDHKHAQTVEAVLKTLPYIRSVLPVETNILVFALKKNISQQRFLNTLKSKGVEAVAFGEQTIRMTFHLGITTEMTENVCRILRTLT